MNDPQKATSNATASINKTSPCGPPFTREVIQAMQKRKPEGKRVILYFDCEWDITESIGDSFVVRYIGVIDRELHFRLEERNGQ